MHPSLLLLRSGANPNAKADDGKRTPGQVADTNCEDEASEEGAKSIQGFLKRWSVLMTVLMLRELAAFHLGM